MSAAIATRTGSRAALRPTFIGQTRGELFKLLRARATWILAAAPLAVTLLFFLIMVNTDQTKTQLEQSPLPFLFRIMNIDLSIARIFVGVFVLIVTATLVGQEYQYGTIRVLLARGVDRVRLLLSKLLAMSLAALGLLAVTLALDLALLPLSAQLATGNTTALNALTGDFWRSAWVYLLTVLVSVGVSILLGAATAVVGRSLAFGISGAIGWFAADNLGVIVMVLVNRLTGNDFWLKVTAFFLGPDLNSMAQAVVPGLPVSVITPRGVLTATLPATGIGFPPLVTYDGAHTLEVALTYAVIFFAVAAVLTWRRDVKE